MCPWVTPSDPPGDLICRKLWLPEGVAYEAAAVGAILQLAESENWEEVTGETAEDVAAAFFEAFNKTVLWEPCMPIGCVQAYGGSVLPDGWLWCNWALYDHDGEHAALFDVIGYDFGQSGDQFRVPNLANRFIYFRDEEDPVGGLGGNSLINVNEAATHPHAHTIPATITTLNDIPVGAVPVLTPGIGTQNTGSFGGGVKLNNKPPYQKFHAIINYR
jgi:microcystin-dependent protein